MKNIFFTIPFMQYETIALTRLCTLKDNLLHEITKYVCFVIIIFVMILTINRRHRHFDYDNQKYLGDVKMYSSASNWYKFKINVWSNKNTQLFDYHGKCTLKNEIENIHFWIFFCIICKTRATIFVRGPHWAFICVSRAIFISNKPF